MSAAQPPPPTREDAATLVAPTLADAITLAAGSELEPPRELPGRIGRFTILRELGAGGMGVVYAAYDEQLDRKVAIKLLRGAGDLATSQGHARLLREAQALARLSHPHVVAVYEVGSFSEHVFLAMEYVQGASLRGWLEAAPRPWHEVLRVFTQAGRGLAAAHAAGLVHRDFKPDNAIVGDDGRVRVLDFGLARAPIVEASEPAAEEPTATTGRVTLGSQLTVAGAVVGTPAYIAPELYMRLPADPRSDQFAFCVALWEAIYGQRPFRGATLQALALAICEGQPVPPPPGRRVPAWLHAALVRGLDPDPARRFATMDALLAVLDRDPERARVRLLGAAVLLGVMAMVGFGLRNLAGSRGELCTDGAAKITSIWGQEQKDSLSAALSASDLGYARDLGSRIGLRLDAYAAAWAAAHRDACEATAVRKEQAPELLELRMACLEDRRNALAETVALLREAEAPTLERAVQAVEGLPAIEPCSNASYVRAEHPLPATAAEAIAEAGARKRFERVAALVHANRGREAELELQQVEPEALPQHLGPELLLVRSQVDMANGRRAAARDDAEQAYLAARRAGDDAVARRAALQVLNRLDHDQRARPVWDLWSRLAETEVTRSGSLRDRLSLQLARANYLRTATTEYWRAHDLLVPALEQCEADRECRDSTLGPYLMNGLGMVYTELGDGEASLALNRRALARWIEMLGPRHPVVGGSLDNVSGALELLGRYEEAASVEEEALAVRLAAYGPDAPVVAESYNNLASVLMQLDQVPRAASYLRETARIEEEAYGPEAPELAVTLMNLGSALHKLGHHEEALRLLLRCEQIQRVTLVPYHAETMYAQALLASVLLVRGDLEGSERHFLAALKVIELRREPDFINAAMVQQNYALLLRKLGRAGEARTLLTRLRERLAQRVGESHVYLAELDTAIAGVELALGDAAAAEQRARQAMRLQDASMAADDPRRFETLAILAELLRERRPAEAVALTEQALPMVAAALPAPEVLAALYETLAIALVHSGGDRERARETACVYDQLLRRAGDTSAASRAPLRALKLLTPPCP
ncbi:protein kinase domain-containing protein [Nannocystis bainbridge]|uniref:Tetratricopeptide repeat protein n=1 Tax=Nannocystis bainbridge TaxID=2995303 RepID=A0ABT5DZS7_9BACT|nr:tetratricopeptide repeat protein [Nannocystis bainbridge]MDC0718663.1 tetratricopeptide repeat protein [Nannocystis bainbridge]